MCSMSKRPTGLREVLGTGGFSVTAHRLGNPDRYRGPDPMTGWQPPTLTPPHLWLRDFPSAEFSPQGHKVDLSYPHTKLSPDSWMKTDTCCWVAQSDPAKLRPLMLPNPSALIMKAVPHSPLSASKQESSYYCGSCWLGWRQNLLSQMVLRVKGDWATGIKLCCPRHPNSNTIISTV